MIKLDLFEFQITLWTDNSFLLANESAASSLGFIYDDLVWINWSCKKSSWTLWWKRYWWEVNSFWCWATSVSCLELVTWQFEEIDGISVKKQKRQWLSNNVNYSSAIWTCWEINLFVRLLKIDAVDSHVLRYIIENENPCAASLSNYLYICYFLSIDIRFPKQLEIRDSIIDHG